MTSDELLEKVIVALVASAVAFASGVTGLVATAQRSLFGAQIPDWLAISLAAAALSVGTGLFAFAAKMLMEIRDMTRDHHKYLRRLMRHAFNEEIDDD